MIASQSANAESLILAARAGQTESLGRLMQTYANYLRLLAASQLDVNLRARVSPSDVVQETLFEAHRNFDQFRGCSGPEFIAWLRRILASTLAGLVERHLMAAKRDARREISLQTLDHSIDESNQRLENILIDHRGSPASNAEIHERVVMLADVLAELPEGYRDVLVLRNLESKGFKEVARRMRRSEGAVRMLWLRAMDELRKRLIERDFQ
jgi:RNA polymerase sigma-70 factor (ECF subfamily)